MKKSLSSCNTGVYIIEEILLSNMDELFVENLNHIGFTEGQLITITKTTKTELYILINDINYLLRRKNLKRVYVNETIKA